MIAETAALAPQGAPSEVLTALRAASAKTGSDFDYLLATAKRESSLDSDAKSKSSSASGLFQFIDQTWLGLVKRYGERHGLGAYAGAIETNSKGRLTVASPEAKAAILALRHNPALSALMAGEAACQTKQSLETQLGRDVCAGELYAAHFLGEGGACQLIKLNESGPNARADLAFPGAAKANRSVFYRADGSPKSIGEVYAWAVDLPEAKSGMAAAKARAAAPVAPQTPKPVMENFVTAEKHRMAAVGPRHTASLDDAQANRIAAHRAYRPMIPVQTRMPSLQLNGLPQSPLLLNAGMMEILSAFAPAMRRSV